MDKAVEALGLNLPQLIAQVANFFVLLVILRLTLYKPILKVLRERQERIARSMADVEAARADKLSAEEALRAASGPEFEQQRAQLESAVTRIAVAARR